MPSASASRSRTKTSCTLFVSPVTRLLAVDVNTTKRPDPLMSGDKLTPVACTPAVLKLTRTVPSEIPRATRGTITNETSARTGTSAEIRTSRRRIAVLRSRGVCDTPGRYSKWIRLDVGNLQCLGARYALRYSLFVQSQAQLSIRPYRVDAREIEERGSRHHVTLLHFRTTRPTRLENAQASTHLAVA